MINNRWIIELSEAGLFNNSSVIFSSNRWFENIDNAAAWVGPGEWLNTHIYTRKQLYERVMKLVKLDEERHRKWEESQRAEESWFDDDE